MLFGNFMLFFFMRIRKQVENKRYTLFCFTYLPSN